MLLQGKNIKLRALEPEDLNWLFNIENDTSFWCVSNTLQPYSKDLLARYIAQAHEDIFTAKQLRLVIENRGTGIGLVDLFDFDPQHHRAGIGILLLPAFQGKGYAFEALNIIINYAFSHLQMHQVYANVISDNYKSIALFEKLGFELVGNKEEWIYTPESYKDELLFQKINKN